MVLDKETAATFGAAPLSHGGMVHFALAAVKHDDSGKMTLDNVVCWGYNRNNLQTMADQRNADIASTRSVIERTMLREDASDMPAVTEDDDAPRKRGRPRKIDA